jgi:PAS domain S-box-containing protein/putative nucleotidyltransferase with HDIG domain
MKIPAGTKVLVVDDDAFLRESIATYLEDSDFDVIEAENGRIGLEKFRSVQPDVVLLDLRMPEMDGLELLPLLVEEDEETPVIIVSGMGTMQDSIEALRLGAWDYITKPIHDMAFLEHAIGRAIERARMTTELRQYRENLESLVAERTTELKQQHALLQSLINSIPDLIFYKDEESRYQGCNKAFEEYAGKAEADLINKDDMELFPQAHAEVQRVADRQMLADGRSRHSEELLEYPDGRRVLVETLKTPFFGPDGDLRGLIGVSRDITERMMAEKEREEHAEKLQATLVQTIQAVAVAMEKRDPYTAGHQQRVALIAEKIAHEMDLEEGVIEGLRLGAMIHDIGKIYVPAEILARPGRLTETEMSIIKTHSQVGYDIVKDVAFPWPVEKMILQHHERLDGSGYPNGIKGDEIILEARILCVADVVEAMASHRPYRAGLGIEAAMEEIKGNSGNIYDPLVVDACVRLFEEKGFTI